ncbi:glycosyltransferase [Sphingobacterium multivorum]|uniref:glycosyltransferase n=1 Tax=Sphingobacterium multivorum TaxID=28454 RepID=UPI002FD9B59F
MKIAFILDHNLMHYRVPLFHFLSLKGYDITVIHSGKEIVGTTFKQIIVKERKIGPFYLKSLPSLMKFDVVIQMQNIRYINTWLLALNISRRNGLVDWTIGSSSKNGLNKSITILDRCRNFLSSFSDSIILYTDFSKFKYSINNQKKIFIANNTIYNEASENLSSFNKDGFLFIGSLNKRKGIDILMESFHQYITEIEDPAIKFLYIIGKGEMSEFVKNYVLENGLGKNVKILGEINDPLVKKEYFRNSIINISPNQAGLSVLESFSFGVPFITNINAISGGEHLNIKEGYNGYLLVDKGDLINRMKFINNNIEEVKMMGNNAYDYYSKKRNFSQMVGAFDQAIELAVNK